MVVTIRNVMHMLVILHYRMVRCANKVIAFLNATTYGTSLTNMTRGTTSSKIQFLHLT